LRRRIGTWGFLFARPDPPPVIADTFKYLLYKDPQWDWRTFDLDRDLEKAEASPDIRSADAIDPNLQPFVQRRGKLLMYHGWSDPLVAPGTSVNYLNNVLARMGGAARTSANTFDAVGALDEWVENASRLNALSRRTQPMDASIARARSARTRSLRFTKEPAASTTRTTSPAECSEPASVGARPGD
jgi:hypothetical protein